MIYDKFAARYDQAFAPFEKKFLRKWREETLALLPKNARILEIGAGTGANFEFYPPVKFAAASEPSAAMLDFARRRSGSAGIVCAAAERLPFAAHSFDAAVATLVFCSIENPADAFAELKRTVVPGGVIVLLEHVRPPGIFGGVFDFLNIFTTRLIEDHFNRETAKLAEKSGLRVREIRTKAFGIVNLIVCEVV